ncbi:MAG TPA: rhamnulokinase family protein [Candidatus Sulfotelmatobacter sp.]|jgi:rhamnulokinase|nr:rhamnulokinase family protein [Candidatus Sulfotelmatobacter sp.]
MPDGTSSRPYLAFDFGAESARAIVARLDSGVLSIKEIRRFKNEPVEYGGGLHWDVARLWYEVRNTLAGLDEGPLASIGVDAWGVDYALLGEEGDLLQNPFHYRDKRTLGIMQEVFKRVPKELIYQTTGIQFMPINTLYQLFAAARDTPLLLNAARKLITIPDLFHYWLTGNAVCEFTNATTTQLVDPRTRTWAKQLIALLGLPDHLWGEIVEPGTAVGSLLPEIARNFALAGVPVIAPASHDTGSAVAAISARDGDAFLSSGTWSLLGTELDAPHITAESMRLNFTNEGGVNGTTRLLKNVMGLWMLQACCRSWAAQGQLFEHSELMELAARAESFSSLVDPDHESFLNPADMPKSMDGFCLRTHQPPPAGIPGYVRTVLESLAFKYRLVISSLEQLTGRRIERIKVIGGGSKNRLLNQLTADATGKVVLAGPTEATALGNVAIQILATNQASSLEEVREIVARSFPVEKFEPIDTDKWERQAQRFEHYCEAVYA